MSVSGGHLRLRRTANDRWKERWATRLRYSMVAAVVAHIALFAIWPNWERIRLERERLPEMVQIRPILAPGGGSDAGLQIAQMLAELEEPELSSREDGHSMQETETLGEGLDELLYAARDPIPRTANPVASTLSGPGRLQQLDEMRLDLLSAITPRVALLPPTVAWPLIRNPGVVERALRAYARTRLEERGASLVSVMVGINERGSVEWAEVHESSGQGGVDRFAVSIFNDVVIFAPARSAGSPVPVQIIVSVLF